MNELVIEFENGSLIKSLPVNERSRRVPHYKITFSFEDVSYELGANTPDEAEENAMIKLVADMAYHKNPNMGKVEVKEI